MTGLQFCNSWENIPSIFPICLYSNPLQLQMHSIFLLVFSFHSLPWPLSLSSLLQYPILPTRLPLKCISFRNVFCSIPSTNPRNTHSNMKLLLPSLQFHKMRFSSSTTKPIALARNWISLFINDQFSLPILKLPLSAGFSSSAKGIPCCLQNHIPIELLLLLLSPLTQTSLARSTPTYTVQVLPWEDGLQKGCSELTGKHTWSFEGLMVIALNTVMASAWPLLSPLVDEPIPLAPLICLLLLS